MHGWVYTQAWNNGSDYFLDLRKMKQVQENASNKWWNTGKTDKDVRREQRVGQFNQNHDKQVSKARNQRSKSAVFLSV